VRHAELHNSKASINIEETKSGRIKQVGHAERMAQKEDDTKL
jgi:hypothetical protein